MAEQTRPTRHVSYPSQSQSENENENQWNNFGRDLEHTRYHPTAPSIRTNATRWIFSTDGPIYWSSPAISADGVVYIGSNDGFLYAIDSTVVGGDDEERLLWRAEIGGRIESSPAIGPDGSIFIGSHTENSLFAFHPNGTLRWRFQATNWFYSSPTVLPDNTLVLCGNFDSFMYALDVATGLEVWRYETGFWIESSPSVDLESELVYFGSWDRNLHCVNLRDGSLVWKFAVEGVIGMIEGTAALARISLANNTRGIFHDGHRREEEEEEKEEEELLVAYIGSYDRHLYAVEALSGEMLWRFPTDLFAGKGSPSVHLLTG